MQNPTVSVVIGTYNRLEFLKPTINTVRQELSNVSHEIIVIDGGSIDGSIDWLTSQKDVVAIIQHNRGEWHGKQIERKSWGYFMNLGFKSAKGKYICMLSDDCLVIPGAITNGIELFDQQLASKKKVGAVAFYWRNWPEQENYWVGLTWGNKMFVNHGLYLREAMEAIGFADEDSYHFYHADGDICLRMDDMGYKCIDSPLSYVEHRSEANLLVRATNNKHQKEDWSAYAKRWAKLEKPQEDWLEKSFNDPGNTAERYWKRGKLMRIFHR
jgi:glycosyltransferase involved in cell wall biosynthesis